VVFAAVAELDSKWTEIGANSPQIELHSGVL